MKIGGLNVTGRVWLVVSEPAGVIYNATTTKKEALRLAKEQNETTMRHHRHVVGPYILKDVEWNA